MVGRDGEAYPPDQWPQSKTFESGDQSNLLVADNQTQAWAALPPDLRQDRSVDAWGGHELAQGGS
ncbi:MAG: hypothetical protein NVSMB32_03570 [Actinomycetota bacterium]